MLHEPITDLDATGVGRALRCQIPLVFVLRLGQNAIQTDRDTSPMQVAVAPPGAPECAG